MDYVESFNLFGTDVSQIPCIRKSGAPTNETKAAVGCLYMNTDNGALYKCVAATDGVYTWRLVETGGGGGDPTALDEHINDKNNPHGVTADIIKALSKETKRVDSLETDALENGIYVGKRYTEDAPNAPDYVCLTLTAPDNRVFQILFEESYETHDDLIEGDMAHIFQYHPTAIVRYWDGRDECWSECVLNFDVKEYVDGRFGECLIYEDFDHLFYYAINNTSEDGGYMDIITENVIKALPVYNGEVV